MKTQSDMWNETIDKLKERGFGTMRVGRKNATLYLHSGTGMMMAYSYNACIGFISPCGIAAVTVTKHGRTTSRHTSGFAVAAKQQGNGLVARMSYRELNNIHNWGHWIGKSMYFEEGEDGLLHGAAGL